MKIALHPSSVRVAPSSTRLQGTRLNRTSLRADSLNVIQLIATRGLLFLVSRADQGSQRTRSPEEHRWRRHGFRFCALCLYTYNRLPDRQVTDQNTFWTAAGLARSLAPSPWLVMLRFERTVISTFCRGLAILDPTSKGTIGTPWRRQFCP